MPGSAQVLLDSVVIVLTWRWLGGFYCAPCCPAVYSFCGSFAVLLRTATRTQLSLCWAFAVRLWKHSMRSRRDVFAKCAGAWRVGHSALLLLPQEQEDVASQHPRLCTAHHVEQLKLQFQLQVEINSRELRSIRRFLFTFFTLLLCVCNRQKRISRRERSMLYILRWFDIDIKWIKMMYHKRNVLHIPNRIIVDEVKRRKIMKNIVRG